MLISVAVVCQVKNEAVLVLGSCYKVSGFLWDFLPKVNLKMRQILPMPLQNTFGAVATNSEGEALNSIKLLF